MKRRTFKDPSSDPRELAYTIDQAAGFESEVRQWLADLPQPFWLDMSFADGLGDGNRMSPLDMLASPSPPSMMTVPPILMAHQCELAITANRLILKLYLPFLRPGAYNSNAFPPHQASHGTVNAAHVIIHASKVLYSVWKQHQQQHTEASEPMLTLTPAMFGFYSFGRTLFDAAVVCAHAAIKQPTSVWAGVAFADVGAALEVMRDPIVEGTGSRGVTGMEGDVSEAVKVIEMMRKKADAARNGMKRKHDEVDGVIELAGFRFPYVGPAVTSVPGRGSPAQQRQQHHCQQPDTDTTPSNPRPKFETKATTASAVHDVGGEEAEKPQSGKLAKKVQYPPVGIRVRPGKEGSPLVRERHRSSSTATSTTTGSNEARMYAPAPLPPLTSAPRAPLTTQPRTPVSGDAGYHHPHHSANLQQDSNQDMYRRSSLAQDIPMQQDVMTQPSGANLSGTIDYPMRFGAGGDDVQMDVNVLTRRRFSIHDLGQNQQPQQHNFPTDNPPTFDQPRPGSLDHSSRGAFDSDSHCSLDRSCGDQYGSASSPYTGRPDTGTPSGPISSASSPYTSSGPAPSSLSTPTFGHHPSPTTYGHQPLHASPTSYAPSPLTNPNLHTFYVTNGYESQYNNGGISLVGLGMEDDNNNGSNMVSAVVDTPSYEKPQRILYDVKSPDAHHLGSGTLQPPFPVDQGRAPSQSHGMSTMLPSQQPWTPESGPGPQAGEYWGGGDFKFYQ
jgi:hypothetical protein